MNGYNSYNSYTKYHNITTANGNRGYYNFPIGANRFYLLYSFTGLELINVNDYTERYHFAAMANIDAIRMITMPNCDGTTSNKLMLALHKTGFQTVEFNYSGSEVKVEYGTLIPATLECRDFMQIGEYLICTNQETSKGDHFEDVPTPALTVINLFPKV